MQNDDHGARCDCCGDSSAACSEPVKFSNGFRYYVLTPIDPGAAPNGSEQVHAATNDSATARTLLNVIAADGHKASGWDNERLTWFPGLFMATVTWPLGGGTGTGLGHGQRAMSSGRPLERLNRVWQGG